jgi:hypothetical protein
MFTKNSNSQMILFVLLSLSAVTLGQYVFHNSEALRAGGTAPPAPPIPYKGNSGNLTADGTAPPAPPIPYDHQSAEPVLQADGTAPPAPPIPYSIMLTAYARALTS